MLTLFRQTSLGVVNETKYVLFDKNLTKVQSQIVHRPSRIRPVRSEDEVGPPTVKQRCDNYMCGRRGVRRSIYTASASAALAAAGGSQRRSAHLQNTTPSALRMRKEKRKWREPHVSTTLYVDIFVSERPPVILTSVTDARSGSVRSVVSYRIFHTQRSSEVTPRVRLIVVESRPASCIVIIVLTIILHTRSSAVADRPRSASCLSVLASTIQ